VVEGKRWEEGREGGREGGRDDEEVLMMILITTNFSSDTP